MIVYLCTSPQFPGEVLRLCAQRIASHPDQSKMKCVIQRMEHGHPVKWLAEDWRTELELLAWISQSRNEGWTIEQDAASARLLDRRAASRERDRLPRLLNSKKPASMMA